MYLSVPEVLLVFFFLQAYIFKFWKCLYTDNFYIKIFFLEFYARYCIFFTPPPLSSSTSYVILNSLQNSRPPLLSLSPLHVLCTCLYAWPCSRLSPFAVAHMEGFRGLCDHHGQWHNHLREERRQFSSTWFKVVVLQTLSVLPQVAFLKAYLSHIIWKKFPGVWWFEYV